MSRHTRRGFLKRLTGMVGAQAAAPYVITSSALGGAGSVPASERITMGILGAGPRGTYVMGHFLIQKGVQWLAVSDCRTARRDAAKRRVDQHNRNADCAAYDDFRQLLARADIDAVLIAAGDRWHALMSILAAKAGKDIYCEKPITLTIAEGRALAEAIQRYGTVYQAGHQRRSVDSYRFQVEAARSGMIGRVHTILCQMWESGTCRPEAPRPVPKGFNYDMWLGPTPYHPYTNARVHRWNDFWDTGAGPLIGMGCHYADIAQWGRHSDDTGPIAYEGQALFAPESFTEVPVSGEVRCTYADGVKLILRSKGAFAERFIRFIGSEGWVQVDDHTNLITAEPASILKARSVSARSWAHTGDHVQDFLRCVKTRQRTVCDAESAHRATTICHAVNICLRLGRSLKWDPKAERFLNDPQADGMISRAMRPPWRL